MLTPNFENIPAELKARPQWVVWRMETRDGKPTKIPYNPAKLNMKARANEPGTWGSFEQAVRVFKRGSFDGVGYEFSADDSYTGIDMDKCRDPETGEIEAWARAIIDRLRSYTEISPSKSGVHIIVKGKLPPGRKKKGQLEMYSDGRYFTMTGVLL